MDWQHEISAARDRIAPHVRRTPAVTVEGFGLDRAVEMKLEQIQHTGSFKARGAFNTLLSRPVPPTGLVAASGGNHGAAVAHAGSRLGHRARIYVPEIAGPAKIALIKRLGADLRVVPGAYANALEAAHAYEAETGAMQIHAYDAPATVAGQGTCMAEWEDQGLQADTVLIAVGGGGLIAGALAWLQGRRKVVAVEPETSCALHAALAAGRPVEVDVSGVAANALGARQIGGICFDMAQAPGTQSVLVADEAITAAQAALMSGAYRPAPGERVAVLVCGGNVAPDPFPD